LDKANTVLQRDPAIAAIHMEAMEAGDDAVGTAAAPKIPTTTGGIPGYRPTVPVATQQPPIRNIFEQGLAGRNKLPANPLFE
jgi:hypothetical protein